MGERRYRPGIAGPLILIFLGVVFLLNNLGVTEWTVWDVVLRFWPVLLIAAGLDLVLSRRSTWGSVVALLIILAVIGLSLGMLQQPPTSYAGPMQIGIPPGSASRAEVKLSPAIGYLRLVAGSTASSDVLHGQVLPFRGENVEQTSQALGNRISIQLATRSWVVVPFITMSFDRPNWDLSVDPDTPLSLRTTLAVGKTELNLTQAQLESLQASTSIGQTVIELPSSTASVNVDGGIGEIVLELPAGTGISIKASTGIGSVDLPSGYTLRSGVYYSPGYDQAEQKLEITADLGIGVIRAR
jgi:hypothetical protein